MAQGESPEFKPQYRKKKKKKKLMLHGVTSQAKGTHGFARIRHRNGREEGTSEGSENTREMGSLVE
jgi:hypothetical protein